jgi:hypothetical protein
MFLVAQLILKKLQVCKPDTVPVYSIVVGLVFYATIFLYLLYKESEYASFFNKFAIYIIGTDLLLSALVHYNTQRAESFNMQNNESDNDTVTASDDEINSESDEEINGDGEGEGEEAIVEYIEVVPPESLSPIPEETPDDLVEEEDINEMPEPVDVQPLPKKRGRPPNASKAV